MAPCLACYGNLEPSWLTFLGDTLEAHRRQCNPGKCTWGIPPNYALILEFICPSHKWAYAPNSILLTQNVENAILLVTVMQS